MIPVIEQIKMTPFPFVQTYSITCINLDQTGLSSVILILLQARKRLVTVYISFKLGSMRKIANLYVIQNAPLVSTASSQQKAILKESLADHQR